MQDLVMKSAKIAVSFLFVKAYVHYTGIFSIILVRQKH